MRTKPFGTAVVGTGLALALTACGPSDGGPSSSTPTPTFSTIPASPSIPAPAPLRADGTDRLSVADMVHEMHERGALPWSARDAISMGELIIRDYRTRDEQCEQTGDYLRYCAARDAQRSGLPSRCIVEAERQDTAPDVGACGIALLYVQHMPAGGGK
ncbi:hypothetical protein [Tsukamurella pseudospumae]|uniref:Uncharacterized protein n=1 Tax=Tsukamurella pseudospumae TaxID=239498 RepID=A0A138ATZ9_9ACTN|nr:hypothetical protein [Tsukamurella pseudospumae]KXP13920.1 hypothetical protein AXK60_22720 [Tsukamurella pseudospumae]